MPRLNRTRYLSCFYCGGKTSTPYDGRVRRFECPSCEATNYLDQDGQITDPPVATDKEATPPKFAMARSVSPSPSSAGDVFCAKCVKNQHLLSASLAQYLPDPDDPEYEQLEKNLYRFRRNQEKLYPQVCAECEPRVRQRLEQAAYTAKTDVLRRMLDRSTSTRKMVTHTGWLDVFEAAGRWLWIAGLALQLCWHFSVLAMVIPASDEVIPTRGQITVPLSLLTVIGPLLSLLPAADRLIRWSALASVLSVWWNPRFAQVFRGFTRHISGVSKWYFFQAVAVALRIVLQKAPRLSTPDPALLQAQLAGHLVSAGLAAIVSRVDPGRDTALSNM